MFAFYIFDVLKTMLCATHVSEVEGSSMCNPKGKLKIIGVEARIAFIPNRSGCSPGLWVYRPCGLANVELKLKQSPEPSQQGF